ncbi:GNAT family N-acetyltransferase [Alkalihalobacillus sp. 1P02AB]|uniref:GNAT family N-acetyltransferase n=1 Tax=Alkalihalobacillus sp. 1P02AB TaxID=3132260 RepID=UPI0039A75712
MNDLLSVEYLEQLTRDAIPALSTEVYQSWLLRYANGYTQRANSVHQITDLEIENINEQIGYIEDYYHSKGLDASFKIVEGKKSASLVQCLNKKGYQKVNRSSVLVADLSFNGEFSVRNSNVKVVQVDVDNWLKGFQMLNGAEHKEMRTLKKMLSLSKQETLYLQILNENELVATGFASKGDEFIGLYNIVTKKEARNQGWGTLLLHAFFKWGIQVGGRKVYLQVLQDNQAAQHLYEKFGFNVIYDYYFCTRKRVNEIG